MKAELFPLHCMATVRLRVRQKWVWVKPTAIWYVEFHEAWQKITGRVQGT